VTGSQSCTATSAAVSVTLSDTQDPAITCPGTITANATTGACSATVTVPTPPVTDNCGVRSITGARSDALALTAPYPVGSTIITWTATDVNNRTAFCTQRVVVRDAEPPRITAPGAITQPAEPGRCGRALSTITLGAPVVSDNCPGVLFANDAPAMFPVGATTVTWSAKDAAGNPATATQIVTILDTEYPTLVPQGPVMVTVDPGTCGRSASGVILGQPTVLDNCPNVTVTNNAPSTFPVGTTAVTWTARDASGNTVTATQNVSVSDNQPPTIFTMLTPGFLFPSDHSLRGIQANVIVSDNCPGTSYILVSVTSNEADIGTCKGDLPNDIQGAGINQQDDIFALRAERGVPGFGRVYTVTYAAIDASGNRTYDTRYVMVPVSIPKEAQSEPDAAIPAEITLRQNFPNPFHDRTTIEFTLPERGRVFLAISDLLGRVVQSPADQEFGAGRHTVDFDGSALPAGSYTATLTVNGMARSIVMHVLK
jgi:hypothetical protein